MRGASRSRIQGQARFWYGRSRARLIRMYHLWKEWSAQWPLDQTVLQEPLSLQTPCPNPAAYRQLQNGPWIDKDRSEAQ